MTIRILQLTDLHVFRSPDVELRGVATYRFLQRVVEHVRASGVRPDHVVVTGDHTHDELAQSYQLVRELLSPWLDRLWQVPGNHDDRSVMRSVFSDRIVGHGSDPIQFHFEAGDWLCIGLDTHVPGSVAGRIDHAQVRWARELADRTGKSRIALFFHHPPVLRGSVWMDAIGLEGKELLQAWCCSDDRVRLVCCGHIHHEFSSRIGSALVVTTPSTGVQFSPAGTKATVITDRPGYRIIELDGSDFRTTVHRIAEYSVPAG